MVQGEFCARYDTNHKKEIAADDRMGGCRLRSFPRSAGAFPDGYHEVDLQHVPSGEE